MSLTAVGEEVREDQVCSQCSQGEQWMIIKTTPVLRLLSVFLFAPVVKSQNNREGKTLKTINTRQTGDSSDLVAFNKSQSGLLVASSESDIIY